MGSRTCSVETPGGQLFFIIDDGGGDDDGGDNDGDDGGYGDDDLFTDYAGMMRGLYPGQTPNPSR